MSGTISSTHARVAVGRCVLLTALPSGTPAAHRRSAAAPSKAVISGPVGPSPYDIVRAGPSPSLRRDSHSAATREFSPTRLIALSSRSEARRRLPDPAPDGYLGFAGSIGINVLLAPYTPLRVGQNCFYSFDANGRSRNAAPSGTASAGPRRSRIPPDPHQPYDPERRDLDHERDLARDLHLLE